MTFGPPWPPAAGGGLPTMTIALPVLPFAAPGAERRRVEIGGATVLVVLGAVALLALFAGVKTAALVVGGALALALVAAAVLVPSVALTLLVVNEFANVSPVLIDHNGLPGIATPLLGLGALSVLVATRSPQYRARLAAVPVAPALLLACYILAVVPAAVLTRDETVTADKMTELVRDAAFLVVVLALARLVNRPWALAVMIVAPLVVIAALTVVNQLLLNQTSAFLGFANISKASGELTTTPRHAGPMEDSNFWGRLLVLGLPLAIALAHRAGSARRGLAATGWAAAVALLLGAVYLTQSRGTLLCAFVATTVWIAAAGPRVRRQALLLVPLLAMLLLVPGIGNRLVNVSEAFDDAPAYVKDPSIVERAAAGDIAGRIFAEHPVVGTGPATFATQLDDYASRKPDLLIGVTTATHNLYLEIGSETGIVGLAGWAVLIGGIVVLAVRSILWLAGVPPDVPSPAPTRGLAAGALAAVLAWSLASLFLHLAFPRTLWIVLALVGLLHVLSRERLAAAGAAERAVVARSAAGLRTGLAVTAVMAVAGAVVGGTILVNLSEQTFTARATQTLAPTPQVYESYALDVRSRKPVLPAYAAMIQGSQSRAVLKVDAEPATGLVTYTGVGASEEEARRRVGNALDSAPRALQRYGAERQYTLVTVTPAEVTAERVYPALALVLAGLAVAAELAFCLLVLRLWRRRA